MSNIGKIIKVVGSTFLIISAILICYWYLNNKISRQTPDTNSIIDSLSSKIDSIKVENITLIQRNDSIQVKIVEVEKAYEKNTNIILANDVSEDYVFFTNYVSRYIDSNYSHAAKNY